jgi:hypothetical protein
MFDTNALLMMAYVGLAFLVLMLILSHKGNYALKLGIIALTTGFYFLADAGLRNTAGWPAKQALPEKFMLLAAVFDEPDPTKNTAGNLFVWVNAIENGKPTGDPRAYRLPYQKDLHGLLAEAMKKNRQGITQLGKTEPKAKPGGLSWLRGGADDVQDIKIMDMPTPQLPEK